MFINARFLTQSITGVQRYALEISRQMKKIDPTIRFIAPKNIIHPKLAEELGVEVVGSLTGHAWEQIELPAFLRKNGSPLLLSLATTAPIFYKRKIVTVHDLAYIHFPAAVSFQFRLFYRFLIPRVLRSALHITTVSEFSKKDICSKYEIPENKVSLIYNAASLVFKQRNTPRKTKKIIIAVGSIQPYKNIEALVSAFEIFNKNRVDKYVLKLVGGTNKKVFRKVSLNAVIGERDNVEFTGYLNDDELLNLYMSATCFVFPSLFEGFGIPPLEAMASACPVIASSAASIPEVCGDAVLYCDAKDIGDIARKIETMVDDVVLQENLIEKGLENVKRFSWESSAEKLFALAACFR